MSPGTEPGSPLVRTDQLHVCITVLQHESSMLGHLTLSSVPGLSYQLLTATAHSD
jgi:hypothetical protein